MEDYDSRDDNPKKPVLPGNEEKGGGVVKEPGWENRLLKILNHKTYDHLIYVSVITVYLCLPLGFVALAFALRAHDNARAGNYGKAKGDAWIAWVIVIMAVMIDLLIVVIVLRTT